jgi:hypothetical protein
MYEGQVKDTSTLQKVFSTNIGYKHIVFPMVPAEGDDSGENVVLNTKARFFWEDMPFGCVILKNIGELAGVATPNLDKQIQFHQKFMGLSYLNEDNQWVEGSLDASGAPVRYGITSLEDLVASSLPE